MEDEASHQSLVPKMRARVGERAVPIVQNKIARKMAGFLIDQEKSSQERFCNVKVLHKSETRCTLYNISSAPSFSISHGAKDEAADEVSHHEETVADG